MIRKPLRLIFATDIHHAFKSVDDLMAQEGSDMNIGAISGEGVRHQRVITESDNCMAVTMSSMLVVSPTFFSFSRS